MFRGLQKSDKDTIWVMGIFVLALVLRIIYLLQIKNNPHFFSPTMDPLYHDVWAQNIAGGNWMGGKVFFRAPFYAYFLAAVYKIFGHSYIIPRVIQHLIGSLSCVLVYFLAKRLFGRTVAIVAGFIAATYGMLLYFEGELLLDSFLVFFDLLLILLLLKAKDNPRFSKWFICGLILGLSAITRPNILFFIPFIWLWIYLVFKRKKAFKTLLVYSASLLLGSVLIISPVTFRNLIVGGDLVLIASQGGINFYIGNNRNADGVSAIFYREDWQYRDFQQMAEKETGKQMKPSEISNFYYRKGINFHLNDPVQGLKLLTRKLYLFWNRFELSNNQDIYFFRRYSSLLRILPLGFWLVGPLGLVGMILSLRVVRNSQKARFKKFAHGRENTWLLVLFIFTYMFTVVMFFVPARFRLPAIPFLIIFTGYAVVWLVERVSEKEFSLLRNFVFLLVPFVLLTNSNAYHLNVGDFSQAHFSLGNAYLKQGKLNLALTQFDSVLATNPQHSRVHLNRGMVFFRRGDYKEAEKEFLAELELYPSEAKAYNNLSAIYLEQGLYDQAEVMAQKAVQAGSHTPNAYMNLALSYWNRGEIDKAREILLQGLSRVQPFPEAELLLGEIYLAEVKLDSAAERFRKVIQLSSAGDVAYDLEMLASKGDPLRLESGHIRAKAHFNLATVHMQRGELTAAEAQINQAISLKPDFAEAHANLGLLYDHTGRGAEALPLFKKAVELDPQNAVYHYNLGLAYAKRSRFAEAKQELQKTLELDPSFSEAHKRLILVDSLLQRQDSSP
jgi:tetratricopeptide (TPR) repeat protein